jgi:hypothetical protein
MSVLEIARLVAFGLAGAALGLASFVTLRFNTTLYLDGGMWRALGLHLARLAVVTLALVVAALQGAGPLIAMAAGLALARPLVMRWASRRS